jgi:predicted PurR-regulated permease PerM
MKMDLRLNWLIAIALTGWLLYLLAPVLTPFIAAALLAYVSDPIADRLERLGMPRTVAVIAVFVLIIVVVALLVILVGPLIGAQVQALFEAIPDIVGQFERVWMPKILGWMNLEPGQDLGIGIFLDKYGELVGDWSGKVLMSVGKSGGALLAAVLSLFLIPIILFYLLRDWDMIIAHLAAIVPESNRETVTQLARESDEVLGAFLRGQLLVMLALATIYSVGLTLVGVKYAVAIGVVSGLVSFVPYLGFIFGITLAGLTVALEPEPLWQLVGVVATFSIAQFIEGSVLTPKLVGNRIGLHPVIVIFAVAAGGQLFGFFGILLALPVAAVLSVLVRFAYNRYLKEHPDARVEFDVE